MENQDSQYKGIVRHQKTKKAIKENENIYQEFFDNPLNGFALCKIITDNKGNPIDFVYLEVNKSFEKFTGLKRENVLNKRVTEVLVPEEVAEIIQIYGKVALTGQSTNFQYPIPSLDKYYEVAAFSPRKKQFIAFFTDITERKKYENKLKESEERYHSLFKNNHAIMLLIDPETGKIVDANPAAASFYDYSIEKLKSMKITDINILTKEQVFEEMQKAQKEKKNHFEFRHRLSNGEIRYVDTYSGIITVEGKNLLYSIVHDITERKELEQKLQKSHYNLEKKVEERTAEIQKAYAEISDLYNNAPIGYHSLDKEGYIVRINDTELSWLGYSKEEIIGKKKFTDLITDESIKTFQKNYKGFMERGNVNNLEFNMVRKNKTILPVLISATAVKDDKGNFIMSRSTLSDITKLKEADEQQRIYVHELEISNEEIRHSQLELRALHSKYHELFESAPVGYFQIDNKGNIQDVNSTAADLLGYNKSNLIERSLIIFIYATSLKDYYNALKEAVEMGKKTVELKMVRTDKKIFIALAEFVFNKENQQFKVTISDITRMKKTEEELKETIQELERSNEDLQSFAYITSHDLQEPLRTIASFTQLLERRYKGKFDKDADEFMDYIVDASVRMKQMIIDLLEYSRVGTRGKEFEEYNSDRSLNRALKHLQSSIEEHHAQITSDQLPVIYADKKQITRVFQNLISNALKFHKKGINPKIHVSARKEGNEYIFSVQDNGIGIEKQYADHIFEVFKKLHTIGEYTGTGIGLAIIKRIIERHDGRIWVESEYGVGSTFYFTIPIKE